MQYTHTIKIGSFVVNTAAVFALLTLFLVAVDFIPEPVATDGPEITVVATASAGATVPEQPAIPESPDPVRIVIEDIGVDTSVTNPASTDIAVLDRALLAGAVRYPGSGALGADANVLIFGHSSYLPVVKNKAYQAFNELQKLTPGARIMVYSDSHRYTYEVDTIRLANAEDTLIEFTASEPRLTLATCNTFGAKQERWVVAAGLVKTEEIL